MILLKLTLLLLIAGLTAIILRRRAPALGHQLATLLMLAGLAFALMSLLFTLPQWHFLVSIPDRFPEAAAQFPERAAPEAPASMAQGREELPVAADQSSRSQQAVALHIPWSALALWIAGVLLLSTRWLRALHNRSQWVRDARPLSNRQRMALNQDPAFLRCVRVSNRAPGAFLWPSRRPRVVLPSTYLQAPGIQVDMVLSHERAHLLRGDGWRFLMLRAISTLLWFHPLVWWVERRARECAELACDQMVLARGFDAHDYAQALIALVRHSPERLKHMGTPSLGGALKRRVTALLQPEAGQISIGMNAIFLLAVATSVTAVMATTPIVGHNVDAETLVRSVREQLTPHRFQELTSGRLQIATFYDGAIAEDTRVSLELRDENSGASSWIELGPLPKFDQGILRREIDLEPGVYATGQIIVEGVHPDGMVDGVAVSLAQINTEGELQLSRSRSTESNATPRTVCAWPLAFSEERVTHLAESVPKWEMDSLYRLLCGADILPNGRYQL